MKTSNNKMVFNVKDFFDDFEKSKKNDFKVLGKRKKDRKITLGQYKLILKTYFSIYFYEIFFIDKISYFFLGGYYQRAKVSQFIDRNSNKIIPETISGIWFQRATKYLYLYTFFNLQRGSTNLIAKIRKDFKSNNSFDGIPSINKKINEFCENLMFVKHEQWL